MNKIAIILTSIERDKSLFLSLKSILDNLQDNWMIIVGYQAEDKIIKFSHPQIYSYQLPYNCGISYARNNMLEKAYGLGCNYVLLTADSILFNPSMKYLDAVISGMERGSYDLIGLNLVERIPWEANLKLIPNEAFELDFIDQKEKDNKLFVPCDIVRNFWIADIQSVGRCGWDDKLIMCEHEDFFYRYSEAGFKVGCTNICTGTYNKQQNTPEYDKIRQENMRIGKQRLLNKYNLRQWVIYKNIQRIQQCPS